MRAGCRVAGGPNTLPQIFMLFKKAIFQAKKCVFSLSEVRYFEFSWICQALHLRYQLQAILQCTCAVFLSFSLFQILTDNFSWLHIISSYILYSAL